jgi:hypothetical protein
MTSFEVHLVRWRTIPTIDGLLLKCLDEEHARVKIGEVHEGMCGTHQSALKMKWMLKRAWFFTSQLW